MLASACLADDRVAVSALAETDYTDAKFGASGIPKRETYIVMRGRYFSGATVDGSIDQMPFKQILGYLTPKLAKQQYFPAKSIEAADLMLVVHWGVTNPRVSTLEMMARSSSVTDTSNTAAGLMKSQLAQEARAAGVSTEAYIPEGNSLGAMMSMSNNETSQQLWMDHLDQVTDEVLAERTSRDVAQLLGYTRSLQKLKTTLSENEDERTLRFDIGKERYFIIVRAYEMHPAKKSSPPRPAWTVHLNISSPGNNFRTAMERMSTASVAFVGRTTEGVTTVKSRLLDVKVELGEPIILGEVN